MDGAERWAQGEFGGAELGDVRRTRRLVAMTADAVRKPAGRVSEVFQSPSKRQGAYDFLEHEQVSGQQVLRALGQATARRCRELDSVYVVVDGTSLSLTEMVPEQKGFGAIGTYKEGARGLKVMNTLAVSPTGTPLGVLGQVWWARQGGPKNHKRYRPLRERESRHWHEAVDLALNNLRELAPNTKPHVLADREADAAALLQKLLKAGLNFTIRTNVIRKIFWKGAVRSTRHVLQKQPVIGSISVDLERNQHRCARRAHLHLRAIRATVILRDHHLKYERRAEMTIVWAREAARTPHGEKPLDWVLFTNRLVRTKSEAIAVVREYCFRWRIEDFHRAWKRGHCHVEETQLRSPDAVIKWATILAAVASRAEYLRHRAREAPDDPADSEFSQDELDGLFFLKKKEKKRTETIAPNPTLAQAVRWVADLGGYVGNRSSGPPGTTTIGRGLERVLMAAEIFAELRAAGKLR
jgi:Transposase DNA-binding/Transposase DDE domain